MASPRLDLFLRLSAMAALLGGILVLPVPGLPTPMAPYASWTLLLVLLAGGWTAGLLVSRLRASPVLGEILFGMAWVAALGMPALNFLPGLLPLAILVLMLYLASTLKPGDFPQAITWSAAFFGFLFPAIATFGLLALQPGISHKAALLGGLVLGGTTLAVRGRSLSDLYVRDAHLQDALPGVVSATVMLVMAGFALLHAPVGTVAFFGLSLAIGQWGIRPLIHAISGMGRAAILLFSLLSALAFGLMAQRLGLPPLVGAFMAGLFFRINIVGRPLHAALDNLLRNGLVHVLAPLVYVGIGLHFPMHVLNEALVPALLLVPAALLGKVGGIMLGFRLSGSSWREGGAVGTSLIGRGALEFILLWTLYQAGWLTDVLFGALLLTMAVSLLLEPILRLYSNHLVRANGSRSSVSRGRTGVLLVGGGPLARKLAHVLQTGGEPVTLLDRNPGVVEKARADGLQAVAGNALDEESLLQAGAGRVRYLITLMPNAELNTLVAQVARTALDVPAVLVPRLDTRATADDDARAHLSAQILFGASFRLNDWDYHADRGHLEVVEVPIQDDRRPIPTPTRLPVALRRGTSVTPYHHALVVQRGDVLLALQRTDIGFMPEQDRFDALARTCSVLDLAGPLPMVVFFDRVAAALGPKLGMEPDALSTQLMQREAASNTVILPGLAIPHVIVPGQRRFEMLICRCREGIQFPDQPQPVRAAFVLVSTPDERNFHLRALSAIAQIVQQEGFESAWDAAPSEERLRTIMLNTDRLRG